MTDEDIRALIERTLKQDIIRASDRQVGRMDENDPWLIEVATDAREHTEAVLSALRSAGLAVVQDWSTDMSKAPENKTIWIHFKNKLGKGRTVKAVYATKNSMPTDGEFGEYSEEHDDLFAPEGWYEDVYADTGLDYSFFPIFDVTPIAWAPLLPPPSKQEGESDD